MPKQLRPSPQSQPPDAEPAQPQAPAIGWIDPLPIGTRSQHFDPRRSLLRAALAERPSRSAHIFGHLTELNGKFKLRATEVTFAPEAYLGVHHHVGPGIRYVIFGEVTFTEGGQATIYKAGDYFFETGNLAHTAQNKTKLPLRILFVEILPKDWTAPTIIPPKPL